MKSLKTYIKEVKATQFEKDIKKIEKSFKYFGNFDPFGDFLLIFGAIKENLKIVELPIKYKKRVYGSTQISRFKHGFILLKMVIFSYFKFYLFKN